ncbi:MAG: inorganic phosphate transporter [Phycisphaerae bacterium]
MLLSLAQATAPIEPFHVACLILGVGMLLWDTIEVGRNDAVNLTNAVFGARILGRRTILLIAGVGVVAGATLSSDVIETARKGIFDPEMLTINQALAVFVSVYLVDTILLYSYSAYGMPVSTTACLVFELLGAAFAIKFAAVIHWGNSGKVISGIVVSIILSGIASFFIQRAVRGALRDRTKQLAALLLHGGWVGGGMATALCYYMLLKGMKNVAAIKALKKSIDTSEFGEIGFVLILWAVFAIAIHFLLVVFRKKAARLLFPVLAVLGMLSLAFAFGQNDLANCASPGLAVYALVTHLDDGVQAVTRVDVPRWQLFICGVLLVGGMMTRNALRVTKAQIRAGSQADHVALWAPQWCITLAEKLLSLRGRSESLAPRSVDLPTGERMHYDVLRASTITCVSACVIATASSLKLPVSTTYVTFAAILATGFADRIFQRGDSSLKLGRIIWVISSWFISAGIAAVAAGLICRLVYHFSIVGMTVALIINFTVRRIITRRADEQERRVEEEAYERAHPDEFALEDE